MDCIEHQGFVAYLVIEKLKVSLTKVLKKVVLPLEIVVFCFSAVMSCQHIIIAINNRKTQGDTLKPFETPTETQQFNPNTEKQKNTGWLKMVSFDQEERFVK